MKKQLLSLAAACVLLLTGIAFGEAALPDLGFFDPQVLQSLTWTEGTGFYDYVMFSYNETADPFEEYSVSAVKPDTTPALAMTSGNRTVTVRPFVMCSKALAVPCLSVSVSDTSDSISSVVIETENLTLSCAFSSDPSYVGHNPEDGSSYAYAMNIGSNVFTLIGDLADSGAGVNCTVTLDSGKKLSVSSEKYSRREDNPFHWLDLCLKECGLIDKDRALQESLRLYTAQYILHFDDPPKITLSGAPWIDDLTDSIRAYPLKLEYAVTGDSAVSVGVLNYSGSFGSRGRRTSSAVTLAYYCLDKAGKALPFADGSVIRHTEQRCALSSGDETILPVDVPLPKDTVTVMAAISSVTWSDGTVLTVPDRDLVFVDYPARVKDIETPAVEEEPVSI